jgi:hypothetical protein
LDPHSFPYPHHHYSPQQNPISTATRCLMPAVHHHRHRCSHSHVVDTGTVTVTSWSQLPGGILIVILAVIDNWHRSSYISPFSHLVVMLFAGPSGSASCHVLFVQLISMLSAGASPSASHHASTYPGIPLLLVSPPASASCCSLLFLNLNLLLCRCLSPCPSPLVDCCWHLSLCSLYGHHSSFTLVADCHVINATLLQLDGERRMLT